MGSGFSRTVALRLWRLITMLDEGVPRPEIIRRLQITERMFTEDLGRLRKLGIEIKFSRKQRRYTLSWPQNLITIKFSPEEFFYVLYCLKNIDADGSELSQISRKLSLYLSEETDPVYDCGPAYGIGGNITADLTVLLDTLKQAICRRRKTVFFYESPGGNAEIRIVHPYRLIHTPISWYLAGFCEERQAFRNFKLARIRQLKLLQDRFNPRCFDLKAHLGDAFWLRHDPARINNPHIIKVLFRGEAAESIREYRFHSTQAAESHPEGTLVTWRLSYLGEFASWLLQWLGAFEIIEDDDLKNLISRRIEAARTQMTKNHLP